MSSSASAAVGGVARREPQPATAKKGSYTALNLQQYKSAAAGGGGGTGPKHYGTLVHFCIVNWVVTATKRMFSLIVNMIISEPYRYTDETYVVVYVHVVSKLQLALEHFQMFTSSNVYTIIYLLRG